MDPLVIQIEHLQKGEKTVHAFDSSPVQIGRSDLNNLPLHEDFVSLWHGVVRFDESSMVYLDLGSTNGSQHNGRKLESNSPLNVGGDVAVEIGYLRLTFSRDPALAAQATPLHVTQFSSGAEAGEELPPESGTRVMNVAVARPGTPPPRPSATSGAPPPTLRPADPEPEPVSGAAGSGGIPISKFVKLGGAAASPPVLPPPERMRESEDDEDDVAVRTILEPSPLAGNSKLAKAAAAAREAAKKGVRPPDPEPAPREPTREREREPHREPRIERTPPPRERTPEPRPAAGDSRPPATTAREALEQLNPGYTRFRDSWKTLRLELAKKLSELPKPERAPAVELLQQEMPELLKEEQFNQMLGMLGLLPKNRPGAAAPAQEAKAPALGAPGSEGQGTKLLHRFARSYVPGVKEFSSGKEAELLLERIADVLETCAKAFVELRKGHGQFTEHMAVSAAQRSGPLDQAGDGRQVLEYVLDWRTGGRTRVDELMRGFTEVMIHEIAMLSGLREGVRGLLSRLDPEKIEQSVKGGAIFGSPHDKWWAKYTERYHDLVDEESETTAALFGPEFARAYAAVTGEREEQTASRLKGAKKPPREERDEEPAEPDDREAGDREPERKERRPTRPSPRDRK